MAAISLAMTNQSVAQQAACIDSDGDGFGWNGVKAVYQPKLFNQFAWTLYPLTMDGAGTAVLVAV